jgi:hypothetical protein
LKEGNVSTLIPNVPFAEFRKLRARQLKSLKTCEVTADGEYLFTFVNAPTDYIRVQAEGLGVIGNAIKGKEIDELGDDHGG